MILDYEGKPIAVGARIELHPGTDLWASGARFGEVVRITGDVDDGTDVCRVRLDKVRKLVRVAPEDLRVIK